MKRSAGHKILSLLLVLAMMLSLSVGAFATNTEAVGNDKPVIGISWKSNSQDYSYMKHVITAAGGIPVELDKVISTAVAYDEKGMIQDQYLETSGMLKQAYADVVKSKNFSKSNVAKVMEGIDGVFFTGGEDVSPSLFAVPQKEANKGEEINATRDISDYTLMAYCIANDVPTFGVCRGEQIMGIVSGCDFLQDIPDYYAAQDKSYNDEHRMPVGAPHRTYARHDVDSISTDSTWLYDIVGATSLKNVSSWHHQAIKSVEGTDLTVVATTNVNGIEIIEGIENKTKTFCLGVQFHPENDCSLALYQGRKAEALCDVEVCLNFLETLVKYAAEKKAA